MPGEYLDEELKELEAKMKTIRERHEAEREAAIERHEAAMQAMKEEMKDMEKRDKVDISAAMQAFETEVAARRVYHEAPNDVFELIVLQLSDVGKGGWGMGGLNALRLFSKRCLRVVESVATRLTYNGRRGVTFPLAAFNRCKRIEHIRCCGLMSLEGCPNGLKTLVVNMVVKDCFSGRKTLESLEPLSACRELNTLVIRQIYEIFNLSPLSEAQETDNRSVKSH